MSERSKVKLLNIALSQKMAETILILYFFVKPFQHKLAPTSHTIQTRYFQVIECNE